MVGGFECISPPRQSCTLTFDPSLVSWRKGPIICVQVEGREKKIVEKRVRQDKQPLESRLFSLFEEQVSH